MYMFIFIYVFTYIYTFYGSSNGNRPKGAGTLKHQTSTWYEQTGKGVRGVDLLSAGLGTFQITLCMSKLQ